MVSVKVVLDEKDMDTFIEKSQTFTFAVATYFSHWMQQVFDLLQITMIFSNLLLISAYLHSNDKLSIDALVNICFYPSLLYAIIYFLHSMITKTPMGFLIVDLFFRFVIIVKFFMFTYSYLPFMFEGFMYCFPIIVDVSVLVLNLMIMSIYFTEKPNTLLKKSYLMYNAALFILTFSKYYSMSYFSLLVYFLFLALLTFVSLINLNFFKALFAILNKWLLVSIVSIANTFSLQLVVQFWFNFKVFSFIMS